MVASLALCLLLAPDPVALVDFETSEPADGWTRLIRLRLEETRVEQRAPLAGRRALRLVGRARAGGSVGMLRRPLDVRDWRRFDALTFHAKVEATQAVEMRILAIRGDGPASRLRRFTLAPGPWREVVLPLKDWRCHTADQVCGFSRVDQWAILWNRGGGAVTVTKFELRPGTRGDRSWLPTVEDRLKLGFPAGGGRAYESASFRLLTDLELSPDHARRLLDRFEAGLGHLRAAYRLEGELPSRVPFFLFRRREDLHAFLGRLGEHFGIGIQLGARMNAAATMGCTMCAKDEGGEAEYTRWAIKGATYRLLGLTNQPNWVQAGLARAAFLHVAGDREAEASDLGLDFLAEREPVTWEVFFARRGSKDSRQSHSILEYLRVRHGEKLPQVWQAVRALDDRVHKAAAGAIAKVLEMSLADLERGWRAWAEAGK
ncbi:MAG: hypothetical protein ACYSUM_03235 [Planctomycetota bacterium]|jgi:hypothetical protein